MKNIILFVWLSAFAIVLFFSTRTLSYANNCGSPFGGVGDRCCVIVSPGSGCPNSTDRDELQNECMCNEGNVCTWNTDIDPPAPVCRGSVSEEDCGDRGEPCCITPGGLLTCNNLVMNICDTETEKCDFCGHKEGAYCCLMGQECKVDGLECQQVGQFRKCLPKQADGHVCSSRNDYCCTLLPGGGRGRCNYSYPGQPFPEGTCECDGGLICKYTCLGAICRHPSDPPVVCAEDPDPDPDRPWWEIGRHDKVRDLDDYDISPPEIGQIGGIVTRIINYLFPIAGFICLIFIIQGGYMWIVSSGNPENVKKAQGTLTWAIIGLVLTMTVFGILTVIINFLY